MSIVEPLYCLMMKEPDRYSKSEQIFIEAGFFFRVCAELKEVFRKQYHEYFRLMKFNIKMENAMLDAEFICLLIKDILSTNEYSLQGIAYYIDIHEDVIYDILTGRNSDPSATILQKIIDLHYSVRTEFYREIIKKI